ncbi:MAG: outer membrane beta-barrel protein [Holosporales bacterium]|jgi:opacity protein-like surface antigen|nr:outer membrane beta-barrel protein [Holosporales bacterium]
MHKYLATISAAALLASAFAAGAQEGEIASAPDTSAVPCARSTCCLHGPYVGFGLGFAHAKWEPKPETFIKKDDAKKGGVGLGLFFGYAHCFPNGFTVGGEGRVDLYPSTKVEKTTGLYKTELKLNAFSPGVAVFVGHHLSPIRGTVGFAVGGSYAKTDVTVSTGANKFEKSFSSFSPEFGLFYTCKFYKGFGLRADFRYAIGTKKEETVNATKVELKTDRVAFIVNAFYNVSF